MKKFIVLFLFVSGLCFGQITSTAFIRTYSSPGSCIAGASPAVIYNNSGTDTVYVCGSGGTYAAVGMGGGAPSGPAGGALTGTYPNPGIASPLATVAIEDRGGQVYNVKAYGAIGDDTTDDSTAVLLAANTALAAGGGAVYFPHGAYKILSCLTPNFTLPYGQTNPLRFTGDSAQYANTGAGFAASPSGGSILDMSCNNGTHADGKGLDISNATSVSGTTAITGLTSTATVANGDSISCQAIIGGVPTIITPANTTVASFVANTSIALSANALASSSVVGCNVGGNVGGKLNLLGSGRVEIDHLTFEETVSSTNATPFVYSTQAQIQLHDNGFYGHPSDTVFNATEDAIVLGGDINVFASPNGFAGTPADAFQGYGTNIHDNTFHRIRRALLGRTYMNGVHFDNNFVAWNSGTNQTTAITACTNANPAVCTIPVIAIPVRNNGVTTTFKITVSGATGSWTPINGNHTATYVSATTFSIPVNSTAFGALTGSPVTPFGAAVEVYGNSPTMASQFDVGNIFSDNNIEQIGYSFSYLFDQAQNNVIRGEYDGGDASTAGIAHIQFQNSANSNQDQPAFWVGAAYPAFSDAGGSNGNQFITNQQGENSILPGQWLFTGSPGLSIANNKGLTIVDAVGVNRTIMNLDTNNTLTVANPTAATPGNFLMYPSAGKEIRFLNNAETVYILDMRESTTNSSFGGNTEDNYKTSIQKSGTVGTLHIKDLTASTGFTRGVVDPGAADTATTSLWNVNGLSTATSYGTTANCASSASPAVCGSAAAGKFTIAASATTVTVNTTAVTANSEIHVLENQTYGAALSVTCNTGFLSAPPAISAVVAGTSFTVSLLAGLTVNPVCFSYTITN